MKRKLFFLTLLLVLIALSGQSQNQESEYYRIEGDSIVILQNGKYEIKIGKYPYTSDTVCFNKAKMSEYWGEYWKNNPIDTLNPAILIGSDFAIVNEPFARQDLQENQAKDSIIQVQKNTIVKQKEQLARKDTLINQQSRQISDLQERYAAMSSMVVMCERDRKGEKKFRKVFQGAFYVMCGIAFILGVN